MVEDCATDARRQAHAEAANLKDFQSGDQRRRRWRGEEEEGDLTAMVEVREEAVPAMKEETMTIDAMADDLFTMQ